MASTKDMDAWQETEGMDVSSLEHVPINTRSVRFRHTSRWSNDVSITNSLKALLPDKDYQRRLYTLIGPQRLPLLTHMGITNVPLRYIPTLPNIKHLQAAELTNKQFKSIVRFAGLQSLDLSFEGHHLQFPPWSEEYQESSKCTPTPCLAVLSKLPLLNSLKIYKVTNDILLTLPPMSTLTHMDLSNALVTDEALEVLRHLTNLVHLDISDACCEWQNYDSSWDSGPQSEPLTGAWLENLAFLPNLTYLDISVSYGTAYTAAALEVLKTLTKLKHLNLQGVTIPDRDFFQSLTALQSLYLTTDASWVADQLPLSLTSLNLHGHHWDRCPRLNLEHLTNLTQLSFECAMPLETMLPPSIPPCVW